MYEIIMVIMGIIVIAVQIFMIIVLLTFVLSEKEGIYEQRKRTKKDNK